MARLPGALPPAIDLCPFGAFFGRVAEVIGVGELGRGRWHCEPASDGLGSWGASGVDERPLTPALSPEAGERGIRFVALPRVRSRSVATLGYCVTPRTML